MNRDVQLVIQTQLVYKTVQLVKILGTFGRAQLNVKVIVLLGLSQVVGRLEIPLVNMHHHLQLVHLVMQDVVIVMEVLQLIAILAWIVII